MTTDYLKKNFNYKLEGRRNIGRPLMRWEDEEQVKGFIVDGDDDGNICYWLSKDIVLMIDDSLSVQK